MGVINLATAEKDALNAIDEREIDRLVDQAIAGERLGELYRLPLTACGPYVSSKLHYFEKALAGFSRSKAARKRAETKYDLERAGRDLSFAVTQMKRRLEEEEKNRELFHIDDHIFAPYHFNKDMDLRVSFRWRRSAEDEWKSGSITFLYEVDLRPDLNQPLQKRKPSAAKQAEVLQDWLSRTWEHFTMMALCSVRDYFKQGGDGEDIPENFRVTVDSHGSGLNNYSTQFWREQP